MRTLLMGIGALSLLVAACGDDDDSDSTAATEASAAPATEGSSSEASTGDTAAPATEGEESEGSDTATFSSADINIDGAVVSCVSTGESDINFVVQAENSEIDVVAAGVADSGFGAVAVSITGLVEWEGTGEAVVSGSADDAAGGGCCGTVTITGTGASLEDGSQTADFTLVANNSAC